jgi:lysophospholipase L1-like esterase
MKKSAIIVLIMASLFSAAAAADTAADTTNKVLTADKTSVKVIGRTANKNTELWLTQSASGIEFTVTASTLSIQLVGDMTALPVRGNKPEPTNRARYCIYVDGTLLTTGIMNKQKKEEVVFNEAKPRTATVRFIKITEAEQSYMGIKSITVDKDGTIAPTAAKARKIEFIGDSITCGYGVEAKGASENFSTATQNAAKSYAYLTAQALDADYSYVSYSGFGIISGYTGDGNINTASLVPPFYEKVCFSYNDTNFSANKWDFAQFQPGIVVINLGTNDNSYTKGDEEKCTTYQKQYTEFLKTVRKDNPNAYIICTLGIMGDELHDYVDNAAADYTAATGDKNISTFHFAVQNGVVDGFGADCHPSAKTQEKEAGLLTAYIQQLITDGIVK